MQKKIGTSLEKFYYAVELLLIALLASALILLGWFYVFKEIDRYKQNTIATVSTDQELLLEQVSKAVKESVEVSAAAGMSIDLAAQKAVTDIIEKADTSASRDWFLYSADEGVIFEKDRETTRYIKGRDVNALVKHWKLQGGAGTETFADLAANRQSGTVIFTKNGKEGPEIVSLSYIIANRKEYFLGVATRESYIMSVAGVNEHILNLKVFFIFISIGIMILSLHLCLKTYKYHKESSKMNKNIAGKNLQIQELSGKLAKKTEAVRNVSVYDSLTGLYNRKFMESLLSRVNYDMLQPVSIIILDINGLEYLNSTNGYSAGDILLEKTSEILRKACIETDVIARSSSSEFTVLMTGTTETQAYGTVENIKRQFANIDNGELTLSAGIAQMTVKDGKILPVLQKARKSMILEKMLDNNSSSSSIISMLMETLSAFSRETVDHSRRLRMISIGFGKQLGLSPSEVSRLAVAAQLHDVGKIGIPDSILYKQESLQDLEWELIRRHSEIGYDIIKAIPFLDEVAMDVLQHHEHYNGRGYPNGLSGGNITINARIINIIDSFDIMTHKRVYAKTKTVEEALYDLKSKSGSQYDPYLVDEFTKKVTERINRRKGIRQ